MNNLLYFDFLPEELNNIVVSYLSYRDFNYLPYINFDFKTVFYIKFPYLHRLLHNQDITYHLDADEYLNWLRLVENKNHPDIDQYITIGKLNISVSKFYHRNMKQIDMFDAYNIFLVFFDILDKFYSNMNDKLKFHGINLDREKLNIFNLLLFLTSNFGDDPLYFDLYLTGNRNFDINHIAADIYEEYAIGEKKNILLEELDHEQLRSLKEEARDSFNYFFGLLLMLIYEDWIKSGRDIDDEILQFYQKYMY